MPKGHNMGEIWRGCDISLLYLEPRVNPMGMRPTQSHGVPLLDNVLLLQSQNFNYVWRRSPTFSFCTGIHILCSQSWEKPALVGIPKVLRRWLIHKGHHQLRGVMSRRKRKEHVGWLLTECSTTPRKALFGRFVESTGNTCLGLKRESGLASYSQAGGSF